MSQINLNYVTVETSLKWLTDAIFLKWQDCSVQCSVVISLVIEHHEVCYDDDGATAAALAEEETRRYRPTKNYILNKIGQKIVLRLKD